VDAAHGGVEGDGIIAVLPVEKLYRIRTRSEVKPGEI
jgi:nitrogen regulatory protein P-II 1